MLYVIFLWLIYFIMGSLNLLISFSCVNLKKCTVSELQVKFYLGQNEDCSPGDSTSDSSERLLQRGRGERQYICDFGKGGVCAIKHIFSVESFCWCHDTSASHEKQSSSWEDVRIRLIKSAPENICLKIWAASFQKHRVPHFCFPPWTPLGSVGGQQLQWHVV